MASGVKATDGQPITARALASLSVARNFAAGVVRLVLAGALSVALVGCGERTVEATTSLRLGAVLGETADNGFAVANEPPSLQFPGDHGPHPQFRSEWWYVTVVLETDGDLAYGVQLTFFRQGLEPRAANSEDWRSAQMFLAHFAVTDLREGDHQAFERLSRGHEALAGARGAPFAAWLDDWRISAVAGNPDTLVLTAAEGDWQVELNLERSKPIVLQGERGLSHKGPDNASFYYSMPRLQATGTVTRDGEATDVTGLGWLDREWSTSVLAPAYEGWDWFALHMADGSDLMMFQLRRGDGEREASDHGMVSRADGSWAPLAADAYRLTPVEEWRDAAGVSWPVVWRADLAAGVWPVDRRRQRWTIRAALADQVMATSVRYWEGVVTVHDEEGRPIGSGYLEMTGY